jgi:hypothetical protein
MRWSESEILGVLDRCCEAFTFPMLDNGYVYLAATRLTAYRAAEDWALAIEVFGFSPRAGLPDVHVYTFGSRVLRNSGPEDYASREAYESALARNPHNESRFFYPIEEGDWQDEDESFDYVAKDAAVVPLRERLIDIPGVAQLAEHGIELQEPPRLQTFELCRFLAGAHRDAVLASPSERRASVPRELTEVLSLDEWHHPNVVDETQRPSGSPTFQMLARVLVTGDPSAYAPSLPPNTHWRHWPDGGTL